MIEVNLTMKANISKLQLGRDDIVWIKLTGEYSEPEAMHGIAMKTRQMLRDSGHLNQVIVSDSRMEILVVTPEP